MTVVPPTAPLLMRRTPDRERRLLGTSASRMMVSGFVLLALIVLVATLGPLLSPYTPSEIVGAPLQLGGATVFGTDFMGRDVLSRLLNGGTSLVVMSVVSAGVGTALGALIGVLAAYFRGPISAVLLGAIDVVFAFPSVVLALLFVSVVGPNPTVIVLAIALAHVPPVARVIWGATLPIAGREHVLWSRAVGVPTGKILLFDVVPLIMSPLMVELGLRLMWSVSGIAGLSFIGYGIQPPAADWGLMVNENRNGLIINPYAGFLPILMIGIFSLGCYLSAEGFARHMGRIEGHAS